MISENMISQVYSEVHHYQLLKDISYYSVDSGSLKRSYGFIRSCVGNLRPKNTARGWKLEADWKDGYLIWIPLKDIKASNPVELDEYLIANNIEDEPASKWCLKGFFCKQDQIISNIKSK